jgi:hypothetical protein
MSERGKQYRCCYCNFKGTSSSGLNSHIAQSAACLDRIVADNQPHPQKRSHSPIPGDSNFLDDQHDEEPLYSSLLGTQPPTKQARIEVEDEPTEIKMDITYEDFEPPAGEPHPTPLDLQSDFEHLRESQRSSGEQPWAPFSSVDEWDYARWIMESGLSQKKIEEMLKLDIVSRYSLCEVHSGSPRLSSKQQLHLFTTTGLC